MIIPEMGSMAGGRSGLAGALFTPVQQRVLALLFGQPDRRFQSAELIRLAGSGTGAVHRQLSRLEGAGLVTVERSGNQKFYQANHDAPVFEELRSLVAKTVGLVQPLAESLGAQRESILAAFVYGSTARGTDRASSDIDLMVISDSIGYPDLFETLQQAEAILDRKVNPTVMGPKEWKAKRRSKNSFASRVSAQPRLFVLGGESDID
jgi:predicted nucleotidyltransferase